jgi:hypothetical protein
VIVPRITIDIDNFRRRVLQDCLTEAIPQYWEHRAQQFDSVHSDESPLPIDAGSADIGNATPAAQAALACRRHAYLLLSAELPQYVIDEIDEVAA